MTIQEERKLLMKEIKKDRRWQSFWGSTEVLESLYARLNTLDQEIAKDDSCEAQTELLHTELEEGMKAWRLING